MPTVNFVNEKVTAEAQDGEDIRQVARRSGVQLYSGPHKVVNCMGLGLCCSCNVTVKDEGNNCSRKGILERINKWINPLLGLKLLSNPDKEVRLACQTKVQGDIDVETHPPINWHGEKFWS